MRRAPAFLAALACGLALDAPAQEPAALDLFTRADKGHCAACHQLPAATAPTTRADLGPALSGARMRAIGKPAIRAAIEDPTRANASTVMPPFGRHRILEPREIEQLVEFLHALQ